MSDFTTLRVGQLPPEVWSGTDNLPHEVGTNLKRGTVADLATYISGIIDAEAGLAFNPLKITDGQTLPITTTNEWILAGKGTYLQGGGFPNVVCTDDINVITSNGISWYFSFGVNIEGFDDSNVVHKTGDETIDGVKTFTDNLRINGAGLLVNSTDNETGNIVIVDTDEDGFPYIRLGLTASENTAELRIDNINTNSIFQFPNETGTFALKETSVNFKSKSTYALMIADGTPDFPTIYNITNDENKSYERSTYLWKPNGNREWLASTPDN